MTTPKIAVILPCLNEAKAIGNVIDEVRTHLPHADIYVFDNGSTDDSRAISIKKGAQVFIEPERGKGNVVRRMFADVEADAYLMIDADGTYDLSGSPKMIDMVISENVDMVVGSRMTTYDNSASRRGHRLGNHMLTKLLNLFFNVKLTDVLSGYRIFSRRFVKTAPIFATGFEIETILTVHALECRACVREVPINYRERVEGTESKLNTYRDGIRILSAIFFLIKNVRPFLFFSTIAVICTTIAFALAYPLFEEYARTGLVPRFPTAILSTGLVIVGAISFTAGLILDVIANDRRMLKRLQYLNIPAPTSSLNHAKSPPKEH